MSAEPGAALELSQKRHEVQLFVRRQLRAEDQVEELHRVVESPVVDLTLHDKVGYSPHRCRYVPEQAILLVGRQQAEEVSRLGVFVPIT